MGIIDEQIWQHSDAVVKTLALQQLVFGSESVCWLGLGNGGPCVLPSVGLYTVDQWEQVAQCDSLYYTTLCGQPGVTFTRIHWQMKANWQKPYAGQCSGPDIYVGST